MTKKPERKEYSISDNSLKLTCDHCEAKFEMVQNDIKSEAIEKDVEWRYFECPECKKRFTTYIGNGKVENLIHKRNSLKLKLQKETAKGEFLNQKNYLALMAQDDVAAKKIKKIQANLKEVYTIAERELEQVPGVTREGNQA